MNNKILVAYASKYGATAEIAEKIAETLRTSSLEVDVLPASLVEEVGSYAAVVLGSAVYAGNWVKDAARLLELHKRELATRPVWLFSSGPSGKGDPVEILHGWRFPEALQGVADHIKPHDIAVFHGKLDPHKMHLGERLIIKALRAETGDFRDWNAIGDWAHKIRKHLAPLETARV